MRTPEFGKFLLENGRAENLPFCLRICWIIFFHHIEVYQAPKGGEEIVQACARAKDFWKELTAREDLQDKTILITAHGCMVRALLQNVYEDAGIENFWHGCVPPNCCANIVEIKENKAILLAEDVVYYNRI